MRDGTTSAILAHIRRHPRDVGAYEDLVSWLRHVRAQGQPDLAAGAEGRELLAVAPQGGWATVEQMQRLLACLRSLLILDAPDDLDCFMQALEFDREPQRRYWLPRRHRLWVLCRELQRLETDPDARGLLVAMPPRTGKSTGCGFAMAWHMGRHPYTANLMVSYSDTICQHFFDQATQLAGYVESKGRRANKVRSEYNYAEIFPDSLVFDRSAQYETLTLGGQQAYPTLTCRSIGGTLTGATEVGEGGWLYADDLVKDLEQAMSPARLDKLWQQYVNQAYDRRKEGAKLLNVGTIWDVADPQMRMMAAHEGDPAYRTLIIPALDPDTGESNFEYLYGLGFSREYFCDMRRMTDEATWSAKYEGRPHSRKGMLFPADQLQRYLQLPEGDPDSVMAVCDTKDRGEDYLVLLVASRWQGRWYLTDCVCDNGSPDVLRGRVAAKLMETGAQSCRFESNSAGGRFAKDVSDMLAERGALCAVTTKFTSSNKETRILAASPWVTNQLAFRDPTLYDESSDYGRLMRQVVGYTLEGRVPHDDGPDALSMLADLLSVRPRSAARAIRRPF